MMDSHDYSEINRATLHTGQHAISTCIDTLFPESGTKNKTKYSHVRRVRKIHGEGSKATKQRPDSHSQHASS